MDGSSFNNLPAELRIKIYEYALTFDRVSCRPHGSSRFWPERSLTNQLALTRVCKQIRAECQHLPFTLNNLVVGAAPWQKHGFSIAELHILADNVALTIASIPSGLLSASTTLSLDLDPKTKAGFKYGLTGPLINRELIDDWVAIKLFFGRLLRKAQAHNIVLDVTLGDEKYGLHLWCEAGDHQPSETDRETRYELQPQVATTDKDKLHLVVAAMFNTSRILATADQHRTHDWSFCNITKHGDVLLARVAELERAAGTVVDRSIHAWNSSSW